MEETIQQLKEVIISIEDKYYQRNERDFAYELYLKMKSFLTLPPRVEVTPESTKRRFNALEDILQMDDIKKYFFTKTNNTSKLIFRFPDLLIHEYDTRDNQILAIEIKRKVNTQLILKDIAKLIVYCQGSLKFKKGVLIIVNPNRRLRITEIPSISQLLKNYPEIEIWIARPQTEIEIICATNLS